MPTAAKLVSAIMMCALGYFAAGLLKAHLPEEEPGHWLIPITAFFALLVGWRFLGKRVGHGMVSAMGLGISSSVALVLICLIWFSGYEMVHRATRMAYGGDPFEAIQDMFQIAIDFAPFLTHGDVIVALIGGGAFVGFLAELTARRWS